MRDQGQTTKRATEVRCRGTLVPSRSRGIKVPATFYGVGKGVPGPDDNTTLVLTQACIPMADAAGHLCART